MKRMWLTALVAAILSVGAMPAIAQETQEKPEDPSPPIGIEPAPAPDEFALFVEQSQVFVDGKAAEWAPAGETVTLKVTVRNGGEKAANDVVLTLDEPAQGMTFTDGTASFGNLGAGDSAVRDYTVTLTEKDCNEFAGVGATISSSLGETPTKLGFAVACPGARLYFENVRYTGGDGDQVPEPGEKLNVFVSLRNQGRDAATDVRGTLTIDNADVTVVDGTASWADIATNTSRENSTAMVIQIDEDAKTAEPCQPFTGGGGIVVDDTPVDGGTAVSSDGTVSSDGSAPSDGGDTPTQIAPVPAEEPVGQEEPGSTGSGSAGTSEPNEGGGSTGSTGSGTIEPDTTSTIEPDGEPSEAPAPRPIEPGTDEGTPVSFEAVLKVTASGSNFDQAFGSGVVCALAEGRPADSTGGGATARDAKPIAAPVDLEDAAATGSPAGTGALASVLLVTVAALVARFRFSV